MLVIRPSHSHQVPQVGRPQIDPVTRQMAVNSAPGTAMARAATPASGCRHTICIKLAIARPVHPPMPSQAAGTWTYMIRTLSP